MWITVYFCGKGDVMETVFSKNYVIQKDHSDGIHATVSQLIRIFMDLSQEHFEVVKGKTYLQDNSLTWFIIQHDITIHEMPIGGDEVTIATEPVFYNQFFTYRRFWLEKQGVKLVETMAQFVLIDVKQRKMSRITDEVVHGFLMSKAVRVPMVKMPKTLEEFSKISRCVDENAIDSNGHVNNTVYLQWVEDMIGGTKDPCRVSVVYEKELFVGDNVDLLYAQLDNQMIIIMKKDEIPIARVLVEKI